MGKGEDEGVAAFNSLGTFFFPFLLFLLFLFFLDFFSFLEGDGELILGFKDFLSDIIEMDQCFAPNLKNLKNEWYTRPRGFDFHKNRCFLVQMLVDSG